MNHSDAWIADVLVVLECTDDKDIPPIVEQLKAAGLNVDEIDTINAVIQGSIDASKVKPLEKITCVRYCRVLETYIADYPTGDPRDLDGAQDTDAEQRNPSSTRFDSPADSNKARFINTIEPAIQYRVDIVDHFRNRDVHAQLTCKRLGHVE